MSSTDFNQNLLLEMALDLASSLNNEDRFDRLLTSIRKAINCDAVALLGLHGQCLTPLAIQGLSHDTLGRRFNVDEHPRLQLLCAVGKPHRFTSDCALPDPFDGLLLARSGDLPVHSCMGLPLFFDNQLMGLVTLDSLTAAAFDGINEKSLALITALSAATLKTAFELKKLAFSAQHAQQLVEELTQEALLRDGGELIGQSPAMLSLKSDIALVANSDYTVLIEGATGVGKELVARTLHQMSARKHRPLVYLNCASLPESLAEAELFGHAKGAFTGAQNARLGKFLLAHGGTLFLDEVGELPLTVQSKLLRVLQSGEIQPVGKDAVEHVDVRVIAATNRDLLAEVEKGNFRADLYHRLAVYPLSVPPLSARGDDVLLLAGYFLEQTARKLGMQQLKLSADACAQLRQYPWHGNVRELEHVIVRAALKAKGADALATAPRRITTLSAELLALPNLLSIAPTDAYAGALASNPFASDLDSNPRRPKPETLRDLKVATDDFQRQLITATLAQTQGNWSEAARCLNLDRANLARLAKRLGVKLSIAARL